MSMMNKYLKKDIYISPEETQEFIDELILKYYNNGISKKKKNTHTKVSKSWQQNNSETVTNKNDKETT